jgi:hypothetical protein
MRRVLLATLPLLVLAVSTPANAQTPQPGPDTKKLEAFVGTWKYEGDAKASPLGPAAKIAGTQTGRMVMSGFALEWKGEEKGPFGGVQWGEMDVYDASSKSYPYFGYQNDGTTWSGSNVLRGDIWAATGTITSKGTSCKYRAEGSFSADGKTWTWKSEISADGKTWTPWTQGTMTKSM